MYTENLSSSSVDGTWCSIQSNYIPKIFRLHLFMVASAPFGLIIIPKIFRLRLFMVPGA